MFIRYTKKTTLNWDNVNFPSCNVDIDTFEQNNEGKVSVNVYFIDPDEGQQSILLYRKSKVLNPTHHIDLLKLEDGDNYHYVFIKDFNKLMYKQIQSKHKAKKWICRHCHRPFEEECLLDQHNENGCMAVEGQKVVMPKFDPTKPDKFFIRFKHHYKKLKAPFKNWNGEHQRNKTDKYQHHRPCRFMINVVNSIDGASEPFLYRGEDCIDVFVNKMIEVKDTMRIQ